MHEMRKVLFTAVACAALIACDAGRNIGSSPTRNRAPNKDATVGGTKDTGIPGSQIDTGIPGSNGHPDAGSPVGGDSGRPLGCGHNPNGCAAHELIQPSTCACLAECEPGWTWNPATSTCLEDGGPRPVPDAGPYDGGVPTTDPFDPASLAQRYATAICQFTTRCEPALHSFFESNETECITEQSAAIESTWTAFAPIISANRLGFSQTAFDRCLAALGNADCVLGADPDACDGMFTGSQAANQRCSFSVECHDGFFCNATSVGGCGNCQAMVGAGQSCAGAACQDGLDCVQLQDGSRVCVPDRQAEGQGCNSVQTGLCAGRMQCVGMGQTFQCMRPAATGAMCDPMAASGPACNIYQNEVCGPMTTCESVNWVGAGNSCAGSSRCNRTSRCDDTMGEMCIAYPAAGQPCAMGLCAENLFCDVSTCTAMKTQGAACQSSSECDGNLRCVSGTCNPLAWTSCN